MPSLIIMNCRGSGIKPDIRKHLLILSMLRPSYFPPWMILILYLLCSTTMGALLEFLISHEPQFRRYYFRAVPKALKLTLSLQRPSRVVILRLPSTARYQPRWLHGQYYCMEEWVEQRCSCWACTRRRYTVCANRAGVVARVGNE